MRMVPPRGCVLVFHVAFLATEIQNSTLCRPSERSMLVVRRHHMKSPARNLSAQLFSLITNFSGSLVPKRQKSRKLSDFIFDLSNHYGNADLID